MDSIKEELVGFVFNVEVQVEADSHEVAAKGIEIPKAEVNQLRYSAADVDGEVKQTGGTSRNAPCPCGSGRKYKRCHGAANA
jgi:preprotein translocase subunit SecA